MPFHPRISYPPPPALAALHRAELELVGLESERRIHALDRVARAVARLGEVGTPDGILAAGGGRARARVGLRPHRHEPAAWSRADRRTRCGSTTRPRGSDSGPSREASRSRSTTRSSRRRSPGAEGRPPRSSTSRRARRPRELRERARLGLVRRRRRSRCRGTGRDAARRNGADGPAADDVDLQVASLYADGLRGRSSARSLRTLLQHRQGCAGGVLDERAPRRAGGRRGHHRPRRSARAATSACAGQLTAARGRGHRRCSRGA